MEPKFRILHETIRHLLHCDICTKENSKCHVCSRSVISSEKAGRKYWFIVDNIDSYNTNKSNGVVCSMRCANMFMLREM